MSHWLHLHVIFYGDLNGMPQDWRMWFEDTVNREHSVTVDAVRGRQWRVEAYPVPKPQESRRNRARLHLTDIRRERVGIVINHAFNQAHLNPQANWNYQDFIFDLLFFHGAKKNHPLSGSGISTPERPIATREA